MSTVYGVRKRSGPGDDWTRAYRWGRPAPGKPWKLRQKTWATRAAAAAFALKLRAKGYQAHAFAIDTFDVVPRTEWGANAPRRPPVRDDWKAGVTVCWHHTADRGPVDDTREAAERHARSMQDFHQSSRGWSDLGYNWLVFPNGDVLEGRGWGVRGAGAADNGREWNTGYCHIAFVGTYTVVEPTLAAQVAADHLVAMLVARDARIKDHVAHGDLMPTSCPGRGVRAVRGL